MLPINRLVLMDPLVPTGGTLLAANQLSILDKQPFRTTCVM